MIKIIACFVLDNYYLGKQGSEGNIIRKLIATTSALLEYLDFTLSDKFAFALVGAAVISVGLITAQAAPCDSYAKADPFGISDFENYGLPHDFRDELNTAIFGFDATLPFSGAANKE